MTIISHSRSRLTLWYFTLFGVLLILTITNLTFVVGTCQECCNNPFIKAECKQAYKGKPGVCCGFSTDSNGFDMPSCCPENYTCEIDKKKQIFQCIYSKSSGTTPYPQPNPAELPGPTTNSSNGGLGDVLLYFIFGICFFLAMIAILCFCLRKLRQTCVRVALNGFNSLRRLLFPAPPTIRSPSAAGGRGRSNIAVPSVPTTPSNQQQEIQLTQQQQQQQQPSRPRLYGIIPASPALSRTPSQQPTATPQGNIPQRSSLFFPQQPSSSNPTTTTTTTTYNPYSAYNSYSSYNSQPNIYNYQPQQQQPPALQQPPSFKPYDNHQQHHDAKQNDEIDQHEAKSDQPSSSTPLHVYYTSNDSNIYNIAPPAYSVYRDESESPISPTTIANQQTRFVNPNLHDVPSPPPPYTADNSTTIPTTLHNTNSNIQFNHHPRSLGVVHEEKDDDNNVDTRLTVNPPLVDDQANR